jgi:hypothetical protein
MAGNSQVRGVTNPLSRSWMTEFARAVWLLDSFPDRFETIFCRVSTRIGVDGRVGSGLYGKLLQKLAGGGNKYDVSVGISGHFFSGVATETEQGKKIEHFLRIHFSTIFHANGRPHCVRRVPEKWV